MGFAVWAAENTNWILRESYFLTGSRSLAEDAAQNAFEKIFKAWPDDEKRNTIQQSRGYVSAIIRNAHSDYHKVPSRSNRNEQALDATENILTGGAGDPESLVPSVREAILNALDETESQMVYLVHYEGHSIGKAGAMIGLEAQQPYRVHARALKKLKIYLEGSEEEG